MTGVLKGTRMKGGSIGSDIKNRANTRHLTRILSILKQEKRMTYTQLRNYTGISSRLGDALRWLENHGLIAKIQSDKNNSWVYVSLEEI